MCCLCSHHNSTVDFHNVLKSTCLEVCFRDNASDELKRSNAPVPQGILKTDENSESQDEEKQQENHRNTAAVEIIIQALMKGTGTTHLRKFGILGSFQTFRDLEKVEVRKKNVQEAAWMAPTEMETPEHRREARKPLKAENQTEEYPTVTSASKIRLCEGMLSLLTPLNEVVESKQGWEHASVKMTSQENEVAEERALKSPSSTNTKAGAVSREIVREGEHPHVKRVRRAVDQGGNSDVFRAARFDADSDAFFVREALAQPFGEQRRGKDLPEKGRDPEKHSAFAPGKEGENPPFASPRVTNRMSANELYAAAAEKRNSESDSSNESGEKSFVEISPGSFLTTAVDDASARSSASLPLASTKNVDSPAFFLRKKQNHFSSKSQASGDDGDYYYNFPPATDDITSHKEPAEKPVLRSDTFKGVQNVESSNRLVPWSATNNFLGVQRQWPPAEMDTHRSLSFIQKNAWQNQPNSALRQRVPFIPHKSSPPQNVPLTSTPTPARTMHKSLFLKSSRRIAANIPSLISKPDIVPSPNRPKHKHSGAQNGPAVLSRAADPELPPGTISHLASHSQEAASPQTLQAALQQVLKELRSIVSDGRRLSLLRQVVEVQCLSPHASVSCEAVLSGLSALLQRVLSADVLEEVPEGKPTGPKVQRRSLARGKMLAMGLTIPACIGIIVGIICIIKVFPCRSTHNRPVTYKKLGECFRCRQDTWGEKGQSLKETDEQFKAKECNLGSKPPWTEDLHKMLGPIRWKSMGQCMYNDSPEEEIFCRTGGR
ncbi:uncharacterized protein LOC136747289 [Amia ocellicauda]|uniref:uncharacterized protein LOC136747289 n=1 Tax=Amia ocellicauda TaxID=2972642 RepID=UPI0034647033